MRHTIELAGFRHRLRPLSLDDAEFVLGLRLRDGVRQFVHETSDSVEAQRAFVTAQLASQSDYSFVLETLDGERTGSFSVYELNEARTRARMGRWLVQPGSRCVPEFALLGYTACFRVLKLESVYAKIPHNNQAALAFQKRIGSQLVAEAEPAVLNGEDVRLLEYEVSRMRWPHVFATLLPLAFAAYKKRSRPAPSSPIERPYDRRPFLRESRVHDLV